MRRFAVVVVLLLPVGTVKAVFKSAFHLVRGEPRIATVAHIRCLSARMGIGVLMPAASTGNGRLSSKLDSEAI